MTSPTRGGAVGIALALTNRVEHIHQLAAVLKRHSVDAEVLHGGLPAAERDRVRAVLSSGGSEPSVLLAIDKVAGEGLDAPHLDTLFLVSPVSFKGRVIQQVGRIMRDTEATKSHVEVHDYLDAEVPLLERMHHKRRRLLERRGFTTTPPPERAPARAHDRSLSTMDATLTMPTVRQVRAWARAQGLDVPARGRLRAAIWDAYRAAHA